LSAALALFVITMLGDLFFFEETGGVMSPYWLYIKRQKEVEFVHKALRRQRKKQRRSEREQSLSKDS
jgi:hypothetical protein